MLSKEDKERNKSKMPIVFITILRGCRSNSFVKKKIFSILNILIIDILCNSSIPKEVKIGNGIRFVHPSGIMINKNAKIGDNCTIFHQVTIGANEHHCPDKAPTIGNNVYMGAGCKILGDIIIGDNVKIGANAVVTKSVDKNCTVVGANKIIINDSK